MNGIGKSNVISPPANSNICSRRPEKLTGKARAVNLESLRQPALLVLVPAIAFRHSRSCHSQLSAPRWQSSSSVASFKRVGAYWSVRIGLRYRALGTDIDDGVLWGWIGGLAEYDHITR